jgi:hypothetical protein
MLEAGMILLALGTVVLFLTVLYHGLVWLNGLSKLELWFWRGLQNVVAWGGVVVFIWPSFFLLIFLVGEGLYWFSEGKWIRMTLCTFDSAMRSWPDPYVNIFVLHQFDRCDVDTGAKGLDIVLNYYVNELSLFVSVPIYSFVGMAVFGWLAGKLGDRADKVEGELRRQRYRERSEDERTEAN